MLPITISNTKHINIIGRGTSMTRRVDVVFIANVLSQLVKIVSNIINLLYNTINSY
jgi:hypothetical protein